MKVCSKCDEEKDDSEFSKNAKMSSGYRSECKACANARNKAYYNLNSDEISIRAKVNRLWTFYRLRLPEYEELISNGCGVCGSHDQLHIDHDHTCCPGRKSCGECIRGVLCKRHNMAEGFFKDADEVMALAQYLQSTWRK